MSAHTSSRGSLIAAALWAAVGLARADEPDTKPLADFSDTSAAENWRAVNDNVMGGVSEGGSRITDEKTLLFTGTLSLENRGGFASIRTRPGE
jgi:monofunctional biosynthetic peptidoglycan transglycosylase